MKVFMVFLALCVVLCGMAVFGTDMERYMLLQKRLKTLAEECARAAALCVDEEKSAASGRPVWDHERGRRAAEAVLEASSLLDPFGSAELKLELYQEGTGAAKAGLAWKGEDLFRMAFITKKEAEASSVYEWK